MKRKPMTEPERKRGRRQTTAERNKRTIFIGYQWERWIQEAVKVYYAKTQEQQSFTSIKATGGRQPVMQESDVS
ncbi:hypothetical protein V1264_024333 [Littorina saxatilis]